MPTMSQSAILRDWIDTSTMGSSYSDSTSASTFWIREQWTTGNSITNNGTGDVYYWSWGTVEYHNGNSQNLNVKIEPQPPPPLTAEQLIEAQRAAEAEAKAAAERTKLREVAKKKGKELLRDIIGDVLFKKLETDGHVDIQSVKHPELRYRLRYGRQIGLVRKSALGIWKEAAEHLCVHPDFGYVEGDATACHAILCLFDEEKLWKTANHNKYSVAPVGAVA